VATIELATPLGKEYLCVAFPLIVSLLDSLGAFCLPVCICPVDCGLYQPVDLIF